MVAAHNMFVELVHDIIFIVSGGSGGGWRHFEGDFAVVVARLHAVDW